MKIVQTDCRKKILMWVNFGSQGRLALISRGDERDTVLCIAQGDCAPSLTTHLGVSTPGHCVYIPSLHVAVTSTCPPYFYCYCIVVIKPWRLCFTLFAFGNSEPVDRNVNVSSSSTTYFSSYWYFFRKPLLVLPGKDLIGHTNSINLHNCQ